MDQKVFKARIEDKYELITASLDALIDKLEREVQKKTTIKTFIHNMREAIEEDNGGDLSKEELQEKGEDMLSRAWEDFRDDFYPKAEENNGKLVGYRCVTLNGEKNLEKFIASLKKGKYLKGFSGIGKWFSWDKNTAECHWGKFGGKNVAVTVKAEIPYASLDIKQMAWANMTMPEEREITLKPGAKLTIVEILDKEGKSLLGDDVKELPAVAEI